MYRKPSPKRQAAHARKLEALRRGRDRVNANKPARLYPPKLPDLRVPSPRSDFWEYP